MPASPGLSTSVGARILRGCGVVLVAACWVGLTVTTPADGAGVRPGDSASGSVSAPAATDSWDPSAPARALPRLANTTASLTSASGKALHTSLLQSVGWLGPQAPAPDREADRATVDALAPVTAANDRVRTVAAAMDTLGLARQLTSAALAAPPEQARRLLAAASSMDDAARAALATHQQKAPASSGVQGALAQASLAAGTSKTPLTQRLAAGLEGARCTGDSSDQRSTTQPVQGLALWPKQDKELSAARAQTFHDAAASLARLGYATEVVADRTKSPGLDTRGKELGVLMRQFQAAQPAGCAPVVTTTAGATPVLVKGGTKALVAARLALADQLRDAAASVTGDARLALAQQWWAEHSR